LTPTAAGAAFTSRPPPLTNGKRKLPKRRPAGCERKIVAAWRGFPSWETDCKNSLKHLINLMPRNLQKKNLSKEISIRAADNNVVPAAFVSNNSVGLVILSHGITTGKEEDGVYTEFAERILAPTFDSIRFDFRGHGESREPSRDVTVCGEILDFMAVVRWARERKYSKLFHVGTSFGASVTLLSLAHFSFHDFASVVFWNPVISYRNTFINATVPWAQEFFNQRTADELAYRAGTKIPETNFVVGPRMAMELLNLRPEETKWPSNLPLLIIHGDHDTSVPHADAVEYCKRYPSATLHTLPGVDHGFDDKIAEAYGKTLEWFRQHA